MRISVIIPAYNSEKTITDAIRSIDNQVIDDKIEIEIEIIVIDDGSTDSTQSLANSYKISSSYTQLRVYHKTNGGVSSARNYGLKISSGEWIAFLDSDDKWLPNKLQRQLDIIKNNPNIKFIGTARNNERLSILGRKINTLYEASVNDLLIKMFPQTSTALVKKDLLDLVGYYNEKMTHSEDGELWIRLCQHGGFYYLPESLVITGNGKKNFGESGLSANLKKMQHGTMLMLDICYKNSVITSWYKYQLLRLFYKIKYWRRLIISMRKK